MADAGRRVRGFQDAEQNFVRDGVAAEAVTDVTAFAHDAKHRLALGVVVAGGRRADGSRGLFGLGRLGGVGRVRRLLGLGFSGFRLRGRCRLGGLLGLDFGGQGLGGQGFGPRLGLCGVHRAGRRGGNGLHGLPASARGVMSGVSMTSGPCSGSGSDTAGASASGATATSAIAAGSTGSEGSTTASAATGSTDATGPMAIGTRSGSGSAATSASGTGSATGSAATFSSATGVGARCGVVGTEPSTGTN